MSITPLNVPVRFFIYDTELDEPGYRECTEQEFIDDDGDINYERNTVRDNGVSQICLTKMPY